MGSPTVRSAVLLPADDLTRVRFIPQPNFNGQVQLLYRAWDQTQGAPGGLIDPVGHTNGENSLSRAVETATQVVRAINDAPVLILGGTRTYVRNAAPFVLSPAAIVEDIDSPNFDGGQLRVRISTGADSSNRLAIGGGFTVDADNNVVFGGVTIGRRTSSGAGLQELVIVFNADATPALAQSLVRAITFRTVGGPLGLRNILFSLTDGDGGASDIRSVRVNVVDE
jgi:hypothetical protein